MSTWICQKIKGKKEEKKNRNKESCGKAKQHDVAIKSSISYHFPFLSVRDASNVIAKRLKWILDFLSTSSILVVANRETDGDQPEGDDYMVIDPRQGEQWQDHLVS